MPRTRRLAAIAMVAVMVLASGCAGFGTGGSADGDGEADADDGSDDPEGGNDTQEGQDDRPDGGDGASDGGADDGSGEEGDSDGAPSGSDSDSTSGSDADADTGSESKANDGTKDGNESKDSDSGGATDGSSGDGDGDGGDDEAPYGTLTVTVENDDGEPAEGVEVVGIGPGGEIYSGVTDGNGQATFDLGDGAYTWYVSTDGTEYDESSEEEITMDGEDRSIALTVQSDEPGPTETHTLTINNAGTSTVEIEREARPGGDDGEIITAEPDENGVVEVDVEEGTYHVRTDDRNDTMVGIHVDENTEMTLQDPNPDPITIEVVNADTGEGIEGAEISGVCDMWYSSGDDYITGTTGPDGIAEAEPGLSPTNCDANINAEDYEEEVVQLSVPDDDGLVVELTSEQNGGGNGDYDTCNGLSHTEAQSYFEEAPLERGHLDEDNDGVACEDHTSPDAKAIVIVEDENGNSVAGESVMINGQSVETNEAGVASMTFDFGGESGSETVDISVRDEETTLTVENDQGGYLDEKSNIVEITVESATSQGSLTTVTA